MKGKFVDQAEAVRQIGRADHASGKLFTSGAHSYSVRAVGEAALAMREGGKGAQGQRKRKSTGSRFDYKAKFLSDLALLRIPAPTTELVFAPPRRWRFDFCWPDKFIAVEYQGGTYMRGKSGHSNVAGLERDYEKFTEASLLGWRIILINAKTVQTGKAVEWVMRALEI